jgi:hypothetical protein
MVSMSRTRKQPTAEELADLRQHAAELAVRRAYETTTPAERLARFEALDPSQKRPPKRPCIWDRVAFMAWETYADLGVQPCDGTSFGWHF